MITAAPTLAKSHIRLESVRLCHCVPPSTEEDLAP